MAHFAKINSENVVEKVVVVDNADITDENGDEQESLGVSYLQNLYGADTNWVQTSYNKSFRNKYAGIDSIYIADADIFVHKSPYPSWTLDADNVWQPPVAEPESDYIQTWDEENTQWTNLLVDDSPILKTDYTPPS